MGTEFGNCKRLGGIFSTHLRGVPTIIEMAAKTMVNAGG
jgi:hypothetical protein